MKKMGWLALALVTVGVIAVGVASAQQPRPEAQPRQDQKQTDVRVTPEMIRHSRILDTLYFAGVAYGVLELLIILGTRISARLRDAAARVSKRPYVIAILYVVLFTLVTAVFDFPLTYYSGYVVPHQFSLSEQSFGSWMGDQAKALMVGLVIGVLLIPLALLGIRKVRRWWVVLWAGSIPVMVVGFIIAPVFIDPLFNKFEPLKDKILEQRLLQVASSAGIEGSRVYQVDKSKQTKEMNAYVTGLGPTKRIVMWDTLLAKMTPDEVVAAMAHEMGHYVLNHMWKTLAFGTLLSLVTLYLGQFFYDRGLARWGSRWQTLESGDPATLPWLMLIVSVISFLLSPLLNGYSRHMEHQADIFSLEVTHLNEPLARAFVKLAEDSKVEPDPNPFIEFWRYSHPALAKRIEFVRGYRPWEQGKPNELWRGRY